MHYSPLSRLRRRALALAVAVLAGVTPVLTSGGAVPAGAAEPAPKGYWMVASDGGIFAFGGAKFFGSTGAIKLNMPIVGMAATPSGNGYWLVASDGGIFAFGDAGFFGSTGAMKLNRPIVGMAASPSGQGYWLVASDGGVFAFGDAGFFGSTGAIKLNKPITGMTPSGSGKGYRMVATDGGIFSFGDAAFFGSAGGTALAKPIAGMAPTPSGKGYWLAGSDGKVFGYGDASDLGSASSLKSVVAMASTPSGAGYWAVGADGALAPFGDAVDLGRPTGALSKPIVGMAVLPSSASSSGGTTGTTNGVIPGDPSDPSVPAQAILDKLYASGALAGTIGTRPQLEEDPSHPFREICKPFPSCKPATISNAQYAEEIRALGLVGNRLFVGGFIRGLLDPEGDDDKAGKGANIYDDIQYLAELDATTGKVASDLTFTRNAKPNLTVQWMEASPDGQVLYISGRFTEAGGGRAPGFAALQLTGPNAGKLVEGWDPSTATGGSVHTVALAGGRLFIGGAFKEVDGDPTYRMVAAVEARTGKLIRDWVAPPFSGSYVDRAGTPSDDDEGMVNSILVIGPYLAVGGEFLHAGEDAKTWPLGKYDPNGGLTVLNVSDGKTADWRPRNDRPVFQMTLSPDKSFFCAAVGGQGGGVSCLKPGEEWPMWDTAKKPEWPGITEHEQLDRRIAHVDGDALGVAISDKRVYLGGHFDANQDDPDDPCLHRTPSQCFPPFSGDNPNSDADDTSGPHKHLVAYNINEPGIKDGTTDDTWTAWANTPEGPTTLLAGPKALYLGGNFTNLMDRHPGEACWPCAEGKWGGRELVFHPGFAMFPAIEP